MRLQTAPRELELADRYGYQVINDDIDRAVEEICYDSDPTMGGAVE